MIQERDLAHLGGALKMLRLISAVIDRILRPIVQSILADMGVGAVSVVQDSTTPAGQRGEDASDSAVQR